MHKFFAPRMFFALVLFAVIFFAAACRNANPTSTPVPPTVDVPTALPPAPTAPPLTNAPTAVLPTQAPPPRRDGSRSDERATRADQHRDKRRFGSTKQSNREQ